MDGGTARVATVLAGAALGVFLAERLSGGGTTTPLVLLTLAGAPGIVAAVRFAGSRGAEVATPADEPAWRRVERFEELRTAFRDQVATREIDAGERTVAQLETLGGSAPPEVRPHLDALARLCRAQLVLARGDVADGLALLDEVDATTGSELSWLPVRITSVEVRQEHAVIAGAWADAEALALRGCELERTMVRNESRAAVRWPYFLLAAARAAAYQGAHDRAAEHITAAENPTAWLDDRCLDAHVAITRLETVRLAGRVDLLPELVATARELKGDLDPGTDEYGRWEIYRAERAARDRGLEAALPPTPVSDPADPETMEPRRLVATAWELVETQRYEAARGPLAALDAHLDRFNGRDRFAIVRVGAAVAEHLGDQDAARAGIDRLEAIADRLDATSAWAARHAIASLRTEVHLAAGELDAALAEIEAEERRLARGPDAWGSGHRAMVEARARLARETADWPAVERLATEALAGAGEVEALPAPRQADWVHLVELAALAAAVRGDAGAALERLGRARRICGAYGGPRLLSSLLRTEMGVLWRIGQAGRARLIIGPLTAACEGSGWVAFQARAHADIADLGMHLAESAMARSHLDRAIAAHQRLGNGAQVSALRQRREALS